MTQSEKILKDLTKYKLYNKFNNDEYDDKHKYSRFCENQTYLNNILTDYSELCFMFARNLVLLPKILKDGIDESEHCRYFTFWIHDEIRKIDKKRWKKPNNIQHIHHSFYQVQHSIQAEEKNNNCFYEYKSDMELDLWIEWKDLYDYIVNYDDIKSTIDTNGDYCKIYSQYFDHIKRIHNKYKQVCCNEEYSSLCPDGINFKAWCHKNELFNKLPCDPNKENPRASIVHGETPNTSDRQEIDRTNSETHLQHQSDYIAPEETIVNNTDYYTKLSVPLLLLGLSSTVFYLYNFTSFGPLVRSKILGKSKIKDNINEDAQNLLEYDSDNMVSNLYNNDYHINYNPS
ncbi:PIR Superfamily Protein [Plasmodium ovale wallikeri]|uniref:PIR Superfamily Protein n=1 Tax=Plasmodium ovale wallikeri TaxID=864142 RepID=A0A1A9ACH2_PLAOA|nr:PIR Superfamily Protein [Plasmodium ovale wallikeri]SBT56173.1 PIR Superfamily Protein [Plasmodium ovale wallikeri]